MSRYNISNARVSFTDKNGVLTKFGKDVLDRIQEVVGLPNGDRIGDIDTDLTQVNSDISSLQSRVSVLENEVDILQGNEVIWVGINSNTTTQRNRGYVCTSTLTLTLHNPQDQDRVKVKRKNGSVLINGNGQNINGASTYKMALDEEGLQLIYFSGEWHTI